MITLTKVGYFDKYDSRFDCESESVKVQPSNISSVEPDEAGAIVKLVIPQALDGGTITGYIVTETPSEIETAINGVAAINVLSTGNFITNGVETLEDTGSISMEVMNTNIETVSGEEATNEFTLPDGAEGQYKYIEMTVDNGDAILSGDNISTYIFDGVGDFLYLYFINGSWKVIAGTAVLD